MKKLCPESVFSRSYIDEEKDVNKNMCINTIYRCANCGCEVSFSNNDFHRYELNKTTKYKDVFPSSYVGKYNSFLEFECPQCKIKTRVNYGIYYGGHFPVINIDSVMTE